MVQFDVFRQDFAGWLLSCAKERRRSCGASQVTGEDLRVAILLERLAENAQHLDLHVFLIYQTILVEEGLARRFAQQREKLLAEIGVIYTPASATDALRWMCRQVLQDQLEQPVRDKGAEPVGRFARMARRTGGQKPRSTGMLRSIRDDFCTGFSVVGPALAIWHLPIAIGQWRDRAFAGSHAAVPATVMSVTRSGEGKSTGSAGSAVLEFKPSPSVGSCRVTVHSTFPPLAAQPGETVMVVPRSEDCAAHSLVDRRSAVDPDPVRSLPFGWIGLPQTLDMATGATGRSQHDARLAAGLATSPDGCTDEGRGLYRRETQSRMLRLSPRSNPALGQVRTGEIRRGWRSTGSTGSSSG